MNEWYRAEDIAGEKFYRVPKVFAKDKVYRKMTGNAKLLYSYIRDRYELSISNGWTDQYGRIYCHYTREGMALDLGIATKTVTRIMRELAEHDLLFEDERGHGQANRIYIKQAKPKSRTTNVPSKRTTNVPTNELKSFKETEGRQQLSREGKNLCSVKYLYDSRNQYVRHYHELYKEHIGEEHPPLKEVQMEHVEIALSQFDLKRPSDMRYVMDHFFEEMEQPKSKRNINMFKRILPLVAKDAMVDRKWEDKD